MKTSDYVHEVNQLLERFLVYETVFKEYAETCHKIEIGNCLASENFAQLRDYYSRNVLRFNHFVTECQAIPVAPGLHEFHHAFLNALAQMQQGVSTMLMAIDDHGINHKLFARGQHQQAQARAQLDTACADLSQAM